MDGRAVYYCKAADLAKQICCVKSFEKFDDFEVIVFDDFCDVVGTEQGVSLLAFLESRQQQQRIVITSRVDIHKWETLEMHSGVIERLLDHVFIIQLDNCCMYPAPRKGA